MSIVCELRPVSLNLGDSPRIMAFTEGDDVSCDAIDNAIQANGIRPIEFFDNHTLAYERIGFIPWAVLLWTREMFLAKEICTIRRDKFDLLMSGYSVVKDPSIAQKGGDIPISIVLVRNRLVLEYAASESKLFRNAWESLRTCSESKHWVCLCDELTSIPPFGLPNST